ncbi:MAG: hypothetical protein KAW67_04510 [Candidatus Eisenbacteria sp.]|nr:hypothetical protein [Candidatus Eisenbacteria bacterium]
MIGKRLIELMNAEIDGVNSPEVSRALHEHLDDNPDARRHYEELRDVGRVLAEADEASPPEALRRAIMRAAAARGNRKVRAGFLERMKEALSPPPRVRLAYVFAGGVAVGLGLFALISVTLPQMVPGDAANLVGTIGGGERRFVATDPVSFDVPGAAGRASVRYCAESVTLKLSLSSESEVVVVLSYDEDVSFDGLRALQAGDHALRVTGHRAELTHTGTCDYDLLFTDYTESHLPMRMNVFAAGRSVFESSVPPGRE